MGGSMQSLDQAQTEYDNQLPSEKNYCIRCDEEIFDANECCPHCEEIIIEQNKNRGNNADAT
jgi:hypothetical protein